MVLVTGLRIPWATAQANNPAFDVSASQLTDPLNQIDADANINWQTVIQDNIIALNNFVVSADGIIVPANRELIGLAGGLAINVPTGTPFDVRINNVSIARFNSTNQLLSVPLDMGINLINNVSDPLAAQDAATRNYVDTNPATHNLLSATHPDTLAASPPAQGALVKGSAANLWAEFNLGAALQAIRVNAAGNDLEFFTIAGATDELVNVFEAGVQVGAVARQLNFSNGDDFGIVENGGANRFDISISRNVADGIAGLDASGRLAKANQQTSTVYEDESNAWADGIKQTFNPNGTFAGLNIGQVAGDPSTLTDADIWYDSTANKPRTRVNGVSVDLMGYDHSWASSDETTVLTTGVVTGDQRVALSMSITELQAYVTVAPTGGSLVLEIRRNAVSLGTITITTGTKRATTTIAATTVLPTEILDVNITTVNGSPTGLKVGVVGARN